MLTKYSAPEPAKLVLLEGRNIYTFEELEAVYRSRLSTIGMCSEALFYRNGLQHKKKLEFFARFLGQVGRIEEFAVLEIGCGYGALLEHFSPGPRYLGIDLVPEFVAEAKRRFPEREFVVGNLLELENPSFDLSIIAGVLSSVPEPVKMLEAALHASKCGVLFDVTLAERLPREFQDLNRWSVSEVQAIASGCAELILCDPGASWVLFFARNCDRRDKSHSR